MAKGVTKSQLEKVAARAEEDGHRSPLLSTFLHLEEQHGAEAVEEAIKQWRHHK